MAKRRQRRRRSLQIHVTLAGWLFLLTSLLVGLAAVRSHMPVMFIIFGVMLGVVSLSSLLSRAMIRGVDVQRELPPRAWQCETLNFGYFVRNRRSRLACLGLHIEEMAPKGLEDASGYCVHLPPRTVFRAGSRLAVYQRGRMKLGAIRTSTQFPFGLLNCQQKIIQPTDLVVWPAKGSLQADLLRRGASHSSSAPPSRTQGGQDEFFGLREYRQGDNPRWIHWRRSASRGEPVVREMARPVPESLFVIVDVRVQGDDEPARLRREKRLQFVATLIEHALHRGYWVGLALAGPEVPHLFTPATGRGARCDMLDALADVDDRATTTLDAIVQEAPPHSLRNAQVLVVTEEAAHLSDESHYDLVAASRSVEVLQQTDLEDVFSPNPLIAGEGASHAG